MKEGKPIHSLLGITERQHRIHVIYGRRAVGKTTLLLQLMVELMNDLEKNSFLSFIDRKRDKKLMVRIAKSYTHQNLQRVKGSFCKEGKQITCRVNFLASVLYEMFKGNVKAPRIFLDEFFPLHLMTKDLSDISRNLSLLSVLLAKCASRSSNVILTVPETSDFLPLYWNILIEFDPIFYRLRRARRLRDLYKVELSNIPKTGEKWDPKQVRIQAEHLAVLRLSKDNLFSIAKS